MVNFFVEIRDTPLGFRAVATRSSLRTVYLDSDRYYVFRIANLGRLVTNDLTFVRVEEDVLLADAGDMLAIHVANGRFSGVSVTIQNQAYANIFRDWLFNNAVDFLFNVLRLYAAYS